MEGQLSMFDLLPDMMDEETRMIREIMKRGSGYENGCLRIYAAERTLDSDRFTEFLADEFGVGGHSVRSDTITGFVDYNGRGVTVSEWKTDRKWKYSWKKIARIYMDMISTGEFPEYDVIRKYEEARQAGKGAPAPRMKYWK